MLPSELMSPNSFSTEPVDPCVVVGGITPAKKPPNTCTGALVAWPYVKVAVIVCEVVSTAVSATTSCTLPHGLSASEQPASMVSFSPTNNPETAVVPVRHVLVHATATVA